MSWDVADDAVHVRCADANGARVRVQLDGDAWVEVWQLPLEQVPPRAFARLWDARPREPTHVLMRGRGQSPPGGHAYERIHAHKHALPSPGSNGGVQGCSEVALTPYATRRLTRSFGVLPPYSGATSSYMFAETTADASSPTTTPLPAEVVRLAHALDLDAYNQATVNWYRNGEDYLPKHADWVLGATPGSVIASVTLAPLDAGPRPFVLKANHVRSALQQRSELPLPGGEEGPEKVVIETRHGTVIVMGGTTQARYVHSLPCVRGHAEPRINVSLRSYSTCA